MFSPLRIIQNPNISAFQSTDKYTEWRFSETPITLPFAFEIFDWQWWADYVSDHYYYCIYAGLIYLSLIFGLQKFMANRQSYNLKTTLAVWNGALGIFSILGFIRSYPAFENIFSGPGGFYNSICKREGGDMSAAYWSLLFILSKFVELGDTVFIVLRKRPLIFLQWYHHLMTMVVTWIVGPYMEPITRWYTIMNYGVHSLMYPYFSMKALDVKIPRQVSNTITTLQLSQMIMGLFVNFYTMFLINRNVDCYRHPLSIKMFVLVYGSFTILFGRLFYDAMVVVEKKKK